MLTSNSTFAMQKAFFQILLYMTASLLRLCNNKINANEDLLMVVNVD